MSRCTCPRCGAEYSGSNGSGGHCMSCHRTFANEGSGARHREGPYEPRDARRCLTTEEMLARSWRSTPRGWNMYPPMDEETIARRTGAFPHRR